MDWSHSHFSPPESDRLSAPCALTNLEVYDPFSHTSGSGKKNLHHPATPFCARCAGATLPRRQLKITSPLLEFCINLIVRKSVWTSAIWILALQCTMTHNCICMCCYCVVSGQTLWGGQFFSYVLYLILIVVFLNVLCFGHQWGIFYHHLCN